MIKLFNVNPFAEAMLYYLGRANDEKIGEKVNSITKFYSKHKDEIEKATQPACALETVLDSTLNVDNNLVDKYFKKLDSRIPNSPFGFCLASVMVFYMITLHLEYSPNKMCKYLHECDTEERLFSFCIGLNDKYETLYPAKNYTEEFSRQLEKSTLSFENKWKIMNAAFNYHVHIEELLSLIIPAAEIIQASSDKYKILTDEFYNFYQQYDAKTIFESFWRFKIEPTKLVKVAPMILGFDNICATVELTDNAVSDDNPVSSSPAMSGIFIGVARNLINFSPRNDTLALSEKMLTLSDKTRLEILFYLCSHKMYGQELCKKYGLTSSALSYHMSKLLTSGFVTAEISTGKTYYTADKAGIQRMLDAFAEKIK